MQRLSSALDQFLFVSAGSPRPEPSYRLACALAVGFFVFTRAIVIAILALRHYDLLGADPGDYLALADFISRHFYLPAGRELQNAHFPGLSILIALSSLLTRNTVVAGFAVSWSASIASIFLFHGLFRNFRSTLLYVIFVPAWVAPSALIMTEGLTFSLMLTAVWAVHRTERLSLRLFLLFLSGFIVVVRNTSVSFLVPFLGVWWWQQEPGKWPRLLAYAATTALFPVAYLSWNLMTVGVLFPQIQGQEAYFALTADEGYPSELLTWPGLSLLHGFALASVPIFKKLSVGFSLLLCLGVGMRYWRTPNAAPPAELAHPFAAATLAHLFVHLCVGGGWGFSSFDRYIAHINPLLVNGVAGQRQLRWAVLVFATIVGILFAGFSGAAPNPIALAPLLKTTVRWLFVLSQ